MKRNYDYFKYNKFKIIIGFLLIISFSLLYGYIELSGLSKYLSDTKSLQLKISQLGYLGPLAIIFLIAGAVVMSPIPSAPIAIASGFIYGHGWGTLYVLIGAELGAIIAFFIARLLGYDAIQKRFAKQLDVGWLSSSKHLMVTVCVSRLIPFISFDVISYAAGLTKINYLQFSMATLIGIIPVSFLLAHLGSEMVESDLDKMVLTVLFLGLLTLIPVIISMIKHRK